MTLLIATIVRLGQQNSVYAVNLPECSVNEISMATKLAQEMKKAGCVNSGRRLASFDVSPSVVKEMEKLDQIVTEAKAEEETTIEEAQAKEEEVIAEAEAKEGATEIDAMTKEASIMQDVAEKGMMNVCEICLDLVNKAAELKPCEIDRQIAMVFNKSAEDVEVCVSEFESLSFGNGSVSIHRSSILMTTTFVIFFGTATVALLL